MPTLPADRVRALVDRRGAVQNRDVVAALGVAPATAHRLLRSLVTSGVLALEGQGPAARYRLRPIRRRFGRQGLDEDRAWQRVADDIARIRPLDADAARNLRYAATETINNAVEHSGGHAVTVEVSFDRAGATRVVVRDDGVGVFRRLCTDFGFPSPQDAILQLEKGKLTSDPERHSGEGLFFSSKAVSRFRLESQGVAWIVDNLLGDSAIGAGTGRRGTRVTLEVVPGRLRPLAEVFAAYTDPQTLQFAKTRSTVKLGALGEALVSRSEAKRVVEGLPRFTHVTLDFTGVDVVGQGFCDEVFRVFARAHPGTPSSPWA